MARRPMLQRLPLGRPRPDTSPGRRGDGPPVDDLPPTYYDDDPELGVLAGDHGEAGRSSVAVARQVFIEPRERELIRLLIHRADQLAGRTHSVLFTSSIARRAYELVTSEGWEAQLVDEDPAVADLMRRLSFEPVSADAEPIVDLGWVVRDAAQRARHELSARIGNDLELARELLPLQQWLADRIEELQNNELRLGAFDALLAWLVDHDGG